MVTRSLFTGVSGLQSHFDKMDTLSNNISNLNTPGFKKSNVVFKSFISQQTATASAPAEDGSRGGTNPQSVGLGVTTGSVNLDMSQGQLQRTGVNTDLAIQGDGFFTTREAGSNRNIYTRAGSFQFDEDGNLVDPANGNVVQGFTAETENGEINELVSQGQPDDVQVTQEMETIPAQATTFQEIAGNLDASSQKAIDPVTVEYGEGSQVEFQFERVHPEENYFKFNAVWQGNPPSGKQIGSPVEDKITGEPVEGVLELNDNNQVVGVFDNPDQSGFNGVAQVEASNNNQTDYTLNPEEIEFKNQENLFSDLNDFNGELKMQFSNASGDYDVMWQDSDGNWNNFTDVGGTDVSGNIGSNFRMERDSDGAGPTNDRKGELEIFSNFVTNPPSDTRDGDEIFFSLDSSDNNGVLNKTGEELKQEFRWGGSGSNEAFRLSTPEAATSNSGDVGLSQVYNFDEPGALSGISNSSVINELPNKEFRVEFTGATTTVGGETHQNFEVFTDLNGNGNLDNQLDSISGPPMHTGRDVELADGANSVGITISAEDWTDASTATGGDEITFTATEGRSQDTGRPFVVAQDGSATENTTAIFGPGGTVDSPSSMNFTPNSSDSSGILNDTTGSFVNLQRDSASGATADKRADATVQTVASSDVFDSRGEEHTLNYTFEKKNENTWLWNVKNPQPQNDDNPQMAGFGTVTFDENGQQSNAQTFTPKTAENRPPAGPQSDLDGQRGVFFDPPETLEPPQTGASPVEITPDFSNITQFGGNSNLEIADQDGTSQGTLSSLSFDQTGTLQGSYDNGERRELAQLSIANFQNPEGLEKEGGTYFSESANSGIAQPGTAGSGGRGTVTPGALERSNVELSAQFTRVISTQRGFQANNRTITTTDEMVQSVLQLI